MKVACVLLFLCIAVVYQAEAGWWTKATEFVGTAVGTVTRFMGKKQRRRSLNEQLDEDTMQQVDQLCTEEHLTEIEEDGVTFEAVKIAFEKVDKDGNDALDENELDMLLYSLEVFQHCLP